MRSTPASGRKPARQTHRGDRKQAKPPSAEPFRVVPHDFGFDPSIDLDKLNQLVDELEALEAAKKLGK